MSHELHADPAIQAVPMSVPEGSITSGLKDIAYGSLAGGAGKLFEYPFDTVKVRLQSQPDHLPLRYRGPVDCFMQGLKHDGIRGLYRGISAPIVGAAVENASLFFSYNIAQKLYVKALLPQNSSTENIPLGGRLMCAAASGSFASVFLTPIELVKCKMQVQNIPAGTAGMVLPKSMLPGPLGLIRSIYATYGVRGFWNGQTGTFFRETGGSAAWFGAYEYVREALRTWKNTEKNSAGDLMLAGAAAGVSYNVILFPADSVKSRMQTAAIGSATEKAESFWAVGRSMYRSGGISALYRGCGITCARSAPSSALIFLCYETLKERF